MERTKGQDSKGFLDLDADLFNPQQEEGDGDGGGYASHPARMVQRKGHEGQPDHQEPRRVPVAAGHSRQPKGIAVTSRG